MSAELAINNYICDDNKSLTLESLKVYVSEGVDINPLRVVTSFVDKLRDIKGLFSLFSNNKDLVRSSSVKALRSIDSTIFGSSDVNNSPVSKPAPKTKKDAENFLKRYYNYISNKVRGKISFQQVKAIFNNAFNIIVKLLAGAGIVALSIVQPLAIPFALIIVLICMWNAVEQSENIDDPNRKIDLKRSFNNIMSGFKKMFLSVKSQKHEGKFAFISALLVGFLWFIKKSTNFTKFIQVIFANAGKEIARAGALITNVTKKMVDKLPESEVAKAVSDEYFSGKKVDIKFPSKEKIINAGGEAGTTFGKIMVVAVLPIIAIASILYLFAEVVDHFNLKKIKELDDEQEEFAKVL